MELFTSLFPCRGCVQTCSQHRLVVLQRCSSDTSKGLNSLSPEQAQATLGSSFVYPQENGLIDHLGSPQEPLLDSEQGIDGKKKITSSRFSLLLPVYSDGLQTKTDTARMWTPLLLKIPTDLGRKFTSPWFSELQDGSGVLLQESSIVSKPCPFK